MDHRHDRPRGLAILALLGPILGIAGRLVTAPATGAVGALASLAGGLGLRFWAGLIVGLFATDGSVRHAALALGKTLWGAIW